MAVAGYRVSAMRLHGKVALITGGAIISIASVERVMGAAGHAAYLTGQNLCLDGGWMIGHPLVPVYPSERSADDIA